MKRFINFPPTARRPPAYANAADKDQRAWIYARIKLS